jgi:hypothetical protein
MSELQMQSTAFSCSNVADQMTALIDGRLPVLERQKVQSHLEECIECAEKSRSLRDLRSSMRSMPMKTPPANLAMRLRVIASHERARRLQTRTFAARWNSWKIDFDLWMHNLMRPLAIPTAGGFFSAVFLFAMLAPGLVGRGYSTSDDIPTVLYTDAMVKNMIPLAFVDEDLVVEISVDQQGRMVDYSIADCKHLAKTPGMRRLVESNLLFSQFTPATNFGQPRSSKIRISFRNSRIEVRG